MSDFIGYFLMVFGIFSFYVACFKQISVEGDNFVSHYQARKLLIVTGFLTINFGYSMIS